MSRANCGYSSPDEAVACHLLIRRGPTLRVDVGFDPAYDVARPRRLAELPLRNVRGLIDTGASQSCIDAALAAELRLPTINRTQVAGVGGLSEFNVHLVQIRSPELRFTLFTPVTAVNLASGGQAHAVLIGRDFLSHFRLTYDGLSGEVTLEDPSAPALIDPWPDE